MYDCFRCILNSNSSINYQQVSRFELGSRLEIRKQSHTHEWYQDHAVSRGKMIFSKDILITGIYIDEIYFDIYSAANKHTTYICLYMMYASHMKNNMTSNTDIYCLDVIV